MRLSTILLICAFSLSCNAASAPKRKQKVCVLGAGSAGLVSAKQLADHRGEFDIVVFEKNSEVGGLWIYTNNTVHDEHGLPVHSAMYKNLRTNRPKELMAFPDYQQFYGEKRSVVTHRTVLNYLKNYTDHFNLRQYIQFNTLVEKIVPRASNSGDWRATKHEIRTRHLETNETTKTICDVVMICNGHLFTPYIPKIPGIEGFSGKILHSHSYRAPEMFSGKTVAVLGASSSGIDISIDISGFVKKIYLSHNHDKITSLLPPNIHQVSGVVKAVGNTLILKDGTNVTADAFIFCTGYLYSYPMLNEKSGLILEEKYLHPLYKHMINVEYPSMGFIGIPSTVIGFPTFYLQAQYYIKVLRGETILPDKQTMMEDSKLENGVSKRHAHALGEKQWAYYDQLVKESGIEPLPEYYFKGSKLWDECIAKDRWHYKNLDLLILENGDVKVVPSNSTLLNH